MPLLTLNIQSSPDGPDVDGASKGDSESGRSSPREHDAAGEAIHRASFIPRFPLDAPGNRSAAAISACANCYGNCCGAAHQHANESWKKPVVHEQPVVEENAWSMRDLWMHPQGFSRRVVLPSAAR